MNAETTVYVSLFCDGVNESHAGRRFRLATFTRPILAGVTLAWSEQIGSYTDADGATHAINGRQSWMLSGDEHLVGKVAAADAAIHERDRSGVNAKGARQSFDFKCKVCGLTAPCSYENLAPILDRLATHGIKELSICGLAASLKLRSSV